MSDENGQSDDGESRKPRLTLRLANMVVMGDGERRLTRGAARRTSGSDFGQDISTSPPAARRATRNTRTPEAKPIIDDDDEDDEEAQMRRVNTRSGRNVKAVSYAEPSSDQSDDPHPPRRTRRQSHRPNEFIEVDEDEDENGEEDYGRRRLRPRAPPPPKPRRSRPPQPSVRDEMRPRPPRQTRNSARAAQNDEDLDYSDGQGDTHDDDDMELDGDLDAEGEEEEEEEEGDSKPRGYSLRARRQVNYTIPQLLDVADNVRSQSVKAKGKAPARRPASRKSNMPRWGASGAELSRVLGLPVPGGDSVSSTHLFDCLVANFILGLGQPPVFATQALCECSCG